MDAVATCRVATCCKHSTTPSTGWRSTTLTCGSYTDGTRRLRSTKPCRHLISPSRQDERATSACRIAAAGRRRKPLAGKPPGQAACPWYQLRSNIRCSNAGSNARSCQPPSMRVCRYSLGRPWVVACSPANIAPAYRPTRARRVTTSPGSSSRTSMTCTLASSRLFALRLKALAYHRWRRRWRGCEINPALPRHWSAHVRLLNCWASWPSRMSSCRPRFATRSTTCRPRRWAIPNVGLGKTETARLLGFGFFPLEFVVVVFDVGIRLDRPERGDFFVGREQGVVVRLAS